MGCIVFIAKYLLFSVTFVITFLSISIIGLGAVLLHYQEDLFISLPAEVLIIPIVILVAGCVIFLIATCGCCGTIAKKQWLLITYTVPLLILMAGSIFMTTLVRGNTLETTKTQFKLELNNIFADPEMRVVFYVIEGIFTCCGTTGPDAYDNLNINLPPTCCPNLSFDNVTINTNKDISSINDINNISDLVDSIQFCPREEVNSGCSPIIVDLFASLANVLYFCFVALIVIEVIGIFCAIYLSYEFRSTADVKKSYDDVTMVAPQPRAISSLTNPAYRMDYNRERPKVAYRGSPNRNYYM